MEKENEKSRFREMHDKAKDKWKNVKETLWNSEKKEFLGRTGSSWAKILTFYFIFFYPLLLAFWSIMMLMLLQTLDNHEPKYKMERSIIGSTPALGYRPTPPTIPNTLQTGVIWFDSNRTETTKDWVSSLDTFLEPYFKKQDGAQSCSMDIPTTRARVCFVPLKSDSCGYENRYGYEEGKPCVLVKLNRIYDWIPKTITDNEVPTELENLLLEEFEKDLVYVTCVGETKEDEANIGDIDYHPKQGIPSYYYPFTNQKGYLSPFVFVRFKDLTRGVVVKVRCRAWFKNIDSQYFAQETSILIKLRVD